MQSFAIEYIFDIKYINGFLSFYEYKMFEPILKTICQKQTKNMNQTFLLIRLRNYHYYYSLYIILYFAADADFHSVS